MNLGDRHLQDMAWTAARAGDSSLRVHPSHEKLSQTGEARPVEPVEPGIGIRLHQAGVARQTLGMLAAAVGRVKNAAAGGSSPACEAERTEMSDAQALAALCADLRTDFAVDGVIRYGGTRRGSSAIWGITRCWPILGKQGGSREPANRAAAAAVDLDHRSCPLGQVEGRKTERTGRSAGR
jgi:hypothetical protein